MIKTFFPHPTKLAIKNGEKEVENRTLNSDEI